MKKEYKHKMDELGLPLTFDDLKDAALYSHTTQELGEYFITAANQHFALLDMVEQASEILKNLGSQSGEYQPVIDEFQEKARKLLEESK